MNTIIVTYDRSRGDDYGPLIAQLQSLRAEHVQKSVWLICTSMSKEQVYQQLLPYLDANDKLLVAGLSGGALQSPRPQPNAMAPGALSSQYTTNALNAAIADLLIRR